MRLYIIRHGDPDYAQDSLTPQGWKEAEALADRLEGEGIDFFYCSPLGRAKDTAKPLLTRLGRQAIEKDWLREFDQRRICRPDKPGERKIPWDWLPQDWTADERFLSKDHWQENEVMAEARVKEYYDYCIAGFDELLAAHGLVREGYIYRAERESHEKIALFCHLGLECVLLSHILNVSPMTLWHGLTPLPSSVTIFHTEERRQGIASLRASCIGDTSHLYAKGLTPSFAARFCECYSDEERHD